MLFTIVHSISLILSIIAISTCFWAISSSKDRIGKFTFKDVLDGRLDVFTFIAMGGMIVVSMLHLGISGHLIFDYPDTDFYPFFDFMLVCFHIGSNLVFILSAIVIQKAVKVGGGTALKGGKLWP